MSAKDLDIQSKIETILNKDSVGRDLKNYFANLPDKSIRRAIVILSRVYPDKVTISDDDFLFIIYLFSSEKYILQQSFCDFVRSINIIDFTEIQKTKLIDIIKNNIERLSEICTFELDDLLIKLFDPDELILYMEILSRKNNTAVCQHISDILRYKNFSNSNISDEKIAMLKQKIQDWFVNRSL